MSNAPSLSALPQTQPPKKSRKLPGFLLSILIAAAAAGAFLWYGSPLVDMVKAAQFAPPPEITAIDTRIDLTSRGTQIFYATHPSIENKTVLNTHCQSQERTAAILGCYVGDRIYLFDIQNNELDGAMEVTAAHEMLHAAYHRLNPLDKAWVDKLVNAEYTKVKDDPAIKSAMEYYAKAEPGSELDELHSIIGTTIADIDPELEAYYGRYFENRSSIVALNERYNKVFDEVNEQAAKLQKKIQTEGAALKTAISSYETDLQQLNIDIVSFNQRAKVQGGFSSQQSFEVARDALMARVTVLDARQQSINTRVAAYNADIDELNKLSVKANELNESINGVSAPEGV